MQVIRYPTRDYYHLHECRMVTAAENDERYYNLEYADVFWDVCSACIEERRGMHAHNRISAEEVVTHVRKFYEECGEWPSRKQMIDSVDGPSDKTISKRFDSFAEAVEQAKLQIN